MKKCQGTLKKIEKTFMVFYRMMNIRIKGVKG